MDLFLRALLQCSAAMSVISLAYMAFMPVLSKRYTAKWRYYIWQVIALGWIIPFRPKLTIPLFSAETPVIHRIRFIPDISVTAGEPSGIISGETVTASSVNLVWLLFAIWFTGMAGTFLYQALRHIRFIKFVKRWSKDCDDVNALGILEALKTEMKIHGRLELKTCTGIATPMMIGFFRRVIFLPEVNIASDELPLILRHELIHLKRNDLWIKIFALLATALHWFNPVVYFTANAIAGQCEISCDEMVLKGMNLKQRRQYGEMIIGVVRNSLKLNTAFSTNFYGGKKNMKARIFSIMDTNKKKAGILLLGVVLIATAGTGLVFAAGSSEKENYSIAAAKGYAETNGPNIADEQSISVPASTGEPETKRPPYSNDGNKSRAEFLADLGFLEYDEDEHIYRYNGKWVRTVSDLYTWNGKSYGGVSRSQVPDGYYSGEPVDLKIIRNITTNQIEKLAEMTAEETEQALKAEPSAFTEAVKENEALEEQTEAAEPHTASQMAERLIAVKLSDEAIFTPKEWKDILNKIEKGEIALEDESSIGPAKTRKKIKLEEESLDSGGALCLGQYTLKKDDIVKYNLTADNSGIVKVYFTDNGSRLDADLALGHTGYAGDSVIIANQFFLFKNSLEGTYYLWLEYTGFQTLKNISGTIEIAEERN